MATTSALPHGNETPCPGDCRLARVGTLDQPKDRQTDRRTGRQADRQTDRRVILTTKPVRLSSCSGDHSNCKGAEAQLGLL